MKYQNCVAENCLNIIFNFIISVVVVVVVTIVLHSSVPWFH